jgi:tungstate transport system ATP-binding protein
MPELSFTAMEYRIDGKLFLGPLDLTQDCTGVTAVLGANGAGKSLFLSLCQGMISPTSGTVTWDHASAAKTRSKRGIVFQSPTLLRRSVYDNVAFALLATGVDKSQIAPRVDAALARVNLSDKSHAPAGALSGGEGQRMALARAIVNAPDVLLLDEPSSALDPASVRQFEEIVKQIAVQGVAVFIATHDIGQAKRLAHDILFLDMGKIKEHSLADSFFTSPKSNAAQRYLEGRL